MRFKISLSFTGTDFHGWQLQPGKPTLQGVLEERLSVFLRQKIIVNGCSRTDAGVHAMHFVAHFDIKEKLSKKHKTDKKKPNYGKQFLKTLAYQINETTPPSLSIHKIEKIKSEFQAIKSAKQKTYAYYLYKGAKAPPFLERFCWAIPATASIEKIKEAAPFFIGEKNFQALCASNSSVKTFQRTIYDIRIKKITRPFLGMPVKDFYEIEVCGNGFLKNMVRILVGTLVHVALDKIPAEQIKTALARKDRKLMGVTAPAKGLFLKKINY